MDYTPNRGPGGLGDYLRTSTELRRELARRGEIGMAAFRSTARRRSGENARSVRYETQVGGVKRDRQVGVIIAYAPYAAAREFGNVRSPGEHNLHNAIPAIEAG